MQQLQISLIAGLLAFGNVASAQTPAEKSADAPVYEVVKAADVPWQPLNPARGDRGPKAGTLWGDQTRDGASGFLVEFVDGFSSPPHIHNITYRGVVIDGLVHNDDPAAEPMWMAPGSFWTQPAGEVHITSAKGVLTRAFIEIESGPYLVMPPGDAFDRGQRPINVDASNLVWLGPSDTTWIHRTLVSSDSQSPELAFVWGSYKPNNPGGVLIKLPAGLDCELAGESSPLRCVVIAGTLQHRKVESPEPTELSPGSYFGSDGAATHRLSTGANDCIVYVRTRGRFQLSPNSR